MGIKYLDSDSSNGTSGKIKYLDSGTVPMSINSSSPKPSSAMEGVGEGLAAGGLALGGAAVAGYAGKEIGKKAFDVFSRVGAGLSKNALDTVKKHGYDKIQGIGYDQGEYLANKVIPEARANAITSVIKNPTDLDTLNAIGFDPEDASRIGRIEKGRLSVFKNQFSKNPLETSKIIEGVNDKIGSKIREAYTIASKKGVSFSIPKTYSSVKGILRDNGYVDLTRSGNLTTDAEAVSGPMKAIVKEYEALNSSIKNTGTINVNQYRGMLNRLEGALELQNGVVAKTPGNVMVLKIIDKLKEEGRGGVQSGIRGSGINLKKLNKQYSDNKTLLKLGDVLDRGLNDKTEGLEGKVGRLQNKMNELSREKAAKIYGSSFVDDVDLLSAAKEFYPNKEGGAIQWASRQGVKGALATGQALENTGGAIRGMFRGGAKALSKVTPAIAPAGLLLQAIDMANDPEAAQYKAIGLNLAPKGSQDREIQTGRLL